jgi:hypothetical protein
MKQLKKTKNQTMTVSNRGRQATVEQMKEWYETLHSMEVSKEVSPNTYEVGFTAQFGPELEPWGNETIDPETAAMISGS